MQYKVSELAQKANVTKRTIHYYISKGLLMPPMGSGVSSLYDDVHLERLLLIKKLQAEYMPLNKIREYIFEGKNQETVKDKQNCAISTTVSLDLGNKTQEIYIKENVCNIFEIHYSEESAKKYAHIIENVRQYVYKMLED